MKRKLLLPLLIFLCCLFFVESSFAQHEHSHSHTHSSKKNTKEDQMKAAYIYHILNQYVEWTDKQQDGFLIGIVGENKVVKKNLEKIAKKLELQGEKIAVEAWSEKKDINEYQALFIGNVSHEKYDEVLAESTGKQVMTFTDMLLEEEHEHEDHPLKDAKKTRAKLKKVVHTFSDVFNMQHQKEDKEAGKKAIAHAGDTHEHEHKAEEEGHTHDEGNCHHHHHHGSDEVKDKKEEPKPIIRFVKVNNKLKFSITCEPSKGIKLSKGLWKMNHKVNDIDDSQAYHEEK